MLTLLVQQLSGLLANGSLMEPSNVANNFSFEEEATPSNSTGEINSFYFYETEQFTLLWILFIAIVVGNTSVLAALVLTKARKSRMNFFIKHLAFADLLVGLISVLTDIIWHITVSWTAGNLACKVIRFLQAVVTYSSTYVLVALSVDRYDAIIHPMNFSGSWRRARILVACSWLLSVLFSSPIMILYEERVIQGRLQCWIELTKLQWKIYMTLVALLLFVLPALIITACYTIIVYTIWTKSNMLSPTHHASTPLKNGDRAEDELRRASSRGIIPRAKIKTVKMTFVIVFVFILCWSPYIVFDLLQVYGFIPQTQTYIAVANFIQSLAPLNSAANPVIYCMFSTHLCTPLRKVPVLGWLCCGSVPPGGDSSTLTDTTSQRTAPSTRRVNTVQLHL